MRIRRYIGTYDFWLPWTFGYGEGWGSKWFDIGPFTIYWSEYSLPLKEHIAIALYTAVAHHFGRKVAYFIDTIFFMLTGVSGYLKVVKQKG